MAAGKSLLLIIFLLSLSIVVGLIILAFDGLLWFDNPLNGHATALVAFTAIQVLILVLLFARPWIGIRVVFYWSLLYLIILLLNPLTGPMVGISIEAFALYLFGVTPIASTPQFSCPFLCPPFVITYDLLIIIQLVIVVAVLSIQRRVTKATQKS
ncbi:MAG: hypothetical protein QXI52_04405 [Nitrososphaerota archaeon]